ncbi:DNA/RNA helicase domain-containing protein [Delftia sp. WSY_4]|uniref:DNA/RNA helicase domain-containing protein n=1 Tax=unclassified Delftia TaxID=2613839 RepID=UPI00370C5B4E
MIVYQAEKTQFLLDYDERDIEDVIYAKYQAATHRKVAKAEIRSWRESLGYIARLLRDPEIAPDIGVAVEFILPQSSKRIDVILAGHADDGSRRLVVVELKQWSSVGATDRDAIVLLRGGMRPDQARIHPSYQAWSYTAFLEGFNEAIYDGGLQLKPCAYLHNYAADGIIDSPQYQPYIERAPLFLKGDEDRKKLREFIKQHIRHGRGRQVLFDLERGRMRPSKALADVVGKLLKGNSEFALIDDQKEVFEAAKAACRQASASGRPRVLIIEGGPGTGKSVIAVNLLAALREGLTVKYISKNAAPRAVYSDKLIQTRDNAHLVNLFGGSGSFTETVQDAFDVLVVDEAHRLTEKSGFYGNLGTHQVKELIEAAKCSIFFIDEDQRVTLKDVGSKEIIRKFAAERNAEVEEYSLTSQFRCAGSDGYLAWVDHTLQIRTTANPSLADIPFDFQVFDDPSDLHKAIETKNANNRARVVAGYCWPWNSKKNPKLMDVVIGDYERQWNLDQDDSLWIVAPNSVAQVGCIHTCQGLEVDYVGVIIGPDLTIMGDTLVAVPRARDRHDKTMKGFVKMTKEQPAEAARLAESIIKNTYRTLMTRGMKGCYVYATDAKLRAYLREHSAIPASH